MTTQSNTETRKGAQLAALITLLALVVAGFSAEASESYTHDGLHFRFGVGVVAGAATIEQADKRVTFGGPGILDGVQLGFCPTENLTLFLEGDTLTLLGTELDRDAASRDTASESDDEAVVHGYLGGIGIGHYLMPANVYVSVAAGLAIDNVVSTDDGYGYAGHGPGVGVNLMASKELWVDDQWSVGLGAQLLYLANRGPSGELTDHTIAGGMLFTVSHN